MYYKPGIRQTIPLLDYKLVNTVSDYRNKDRLTRNWVCQCDTGNIFSKDHGEPSIKHAKVQRFSFGSKDELRGLLFEMPVDVTTVTVIRTFI